MTVIMKTRRLGAQDCPFGCHLTQLQYLNLIFSRPFQFPLRI